MRGHDNNFNLARCQDCDTDLDEFSDMGAEEMQRASEDPENFVCDTCVEWRERSVSSE